jgi:hypothetical protein
LRGDGNNQGSAANAPLACALFSMAFHETAFEGTKIVL